MKSDKPIGLLFSEIKNIDYQIAGNVITVRADYLSSAESIAGYRVVRSLDGEKPVLLFTVLVDIYDAKEHGVMERIRLDRRDGYYHVFEITCSMLPQDIKVVYSDTIGRHEIPAAKGKP